jgi:hypothetical protein
LGEISKIGDIANEHWKKIDLRSKDSWWTSGIVHAGGAAQPDR